MKVIKENTNNSDQARQVITKLTHDLKTPVHNIIGFSNLLELLMAKDQNASILGYLKIISQEAEHTLNLINSLSLYFREMQIDIEFDEKNILENILENSKKEREKTVVGI